MHSILKGILAALWLVSIFLLGLLLKLAERHKIDEGFIMILIPFMTLVLTALFFGMGALERRRGREPTLIGLGSLLQSRLDETAQALPMLKEIVGSRPTPQMLLKGHIALQELRELREVMQRAAEELHPELKAQREFAELTDLPKHKLGKAPQST